jgi:Mycothiol maleylpyruvate isomerase N-terminal domain
MQSDCIMDRTDVNLAARPSHCANQMRARVRRGQDASVEPLDLATAIGALTTAYQSLTAVAGGLTANDLMRPTRCAGWAVGDVLYHQLQDARRALRVFATPAGGPPDVDDITYWTAWTPGLPGYAENARYVRVSAAAYGDGELVWDWTETAAAACLAAAACPYERVATQGHVLRTADFAATLAVEAAVHYLDLTVDLPAAPPPDPAPLSLVRRVLDGLAGQPGPAGWDDAEYALKGTGRAALTAGDRTRLGAAADRYPLFG